jgi:hypothetical protein
MDHGCKHPAFPQPENLAATLWRYMDLRKFEWLVKHARLFMPSADWLRDSLEGTRPEGDLAWWRREAENASSNDQRRIIEHNCELISRFTNAFRRHYYVSCWHMGSVENEDMWCSYTSQPESVAISTTYAALKEVLPHNVQIGMVRYIDYSKEPIPSMNMLEYIMHKNTSYSFEREVRAVALPPPVNELDSGHFNENLFKSEAINGFRVYAPDVDIRRLIHGVALHPKAPAAFASAIIELCARNRLPRPKPSIFSKRHGAE